MTTEKMKDKIVQILEDKKAIDVEVLNVLEKTSLADFFIICSGTSVPHVKALADEVEFQVKKDEQILPRRVEGADTGRWILMDYGDIVVHIFHKEERAFYDLEKLWKSSPKDLQ